MALKLNKDMTTGISGDYWSIREIRINSEEIIIKLDFYISEVLKKEGKSALDTRTISIPLDKDAVIQGNIYEIAYNGIKECVEFNSTEDV